MRHFNPRAITVEGQGGWVARHCGRLHLGLCLVVNIQPDWALQQILLIDSSLPQTAGLLSIPAAQSKYAAPR